MPRSRLEDAQFREWLQTHTPEWSLVWDRPNPRYSDGPRDCWYVHRAPLPSMEAWSIVWVWSTLLTLRQHARRLRNIAAAIEEFERLRQRPASAKTRLRGAPRSTCRSSSSWTGTMWVATSRFAASFAKSTSSSKPAVAARAPDTAYRKITKRRFGRAMEHRRAGHRLRPAKRRHVPVDDERPQAQRRTGPAGPQRPAHDREALRADQDRTPDRPGVPQDEGRIEALFTLYAIALLVQALIERELRQAMAHEAIEELPIYPEQRQCAHPTTEQVLRLFSLAERHQLRQHGRTVQAFNLTLTDLQRKVLALLGVPASTF